MVRPLRLVLLVAIVSSLAASCSAKAGPSCDISSDDGLRAAYKKATGHDLPKQCVGRSRTFVGLVTIGGFAYDRGCIWSGILYGCEWNPADVGPRALEAAGWKKGDLAARQKLALAWVDEVLHESPLVSEPKLDNERDGRFQHAGKTFAAPSAEPRDNGFVLRYWYEEEAGDLPEMKFTQTEVTFAEDGKILDRKIVDRLVSRLRGE